MKNIFKSMLLILLFITSQSFSQKNDSTKIVDLETRLKQLEDIVQQNELDKILSDAESKSNEKPEHKKSKTFKSGQRSLQALNPEISITGDMFGKYIANKQSFTQDSRSGVFWRTLGIHAQGSLDPFSFMKAVVEIRPGEVELGEAYITWTRFLKNISLTAGKFRQQFGVLNRWHVHAADQIDYPLAMTTILGEDGLNQLGISLEWAMPSLISDANQLTLQITNGQNENLFSGEAFSFPSVLAHLKNYWDLSTNTYLELGLSGMIGENNFRGYDDNNNLILENSRLTTLGGVDLTLFWQPVQQALYNSFTWRSELYFANKELEKSTIKTWGGYSYLQYQFAEQWHIGARFDYTLPFEANNSSKYLYQIVPYIVWNQTHWVKFRLQYNYLNGTEMSQSINTIALQVVFAVGPHKHDRY